MLGNARVSVYWCHSAKICYSFEDINRKLKFEQSGDKLLYIHATFDVVVACCLPISRCNVYIVHCVVLYVLKSINFISKRNFARCVEPFPWIVLLRFWHYLVYSAYCRLEKLKKKKTFGTNSQYPKPYWFPYRTQIPTNMTSINEKQFIQLNVSYKWHNE